MPVTSPAKQKPRVEKRRYLRPDEANRSVEAAGKRGRYPFRDKGLCRRYSISTDGSHTHAGTFGGRPHYCALAFIMKL